MVKLMFSAYKLFKFIKEARKHYLSRQGNPCLLSLETYESAYKYGNYRYIIGIQPKIPTEHFHFSKFYTLFENRIDPDQLGSSGCSI